MPMNASSATGMQRESISVIKTVSLLLMEKEEELERNVCFSREVEVGEKVLTIYQAYLGDVGCVVWDAALVLLKYLDISNCQFNLFGKHVVELGAGTGMMGIAAACLGADVLVTDLHEVMWLINRNIQVNNHLITGSIQAKTLVWGSQLPNSMDHPDYILIADCIYYDQSLDPLIKTMVDLASKDTKILMSYEKRTMMKDIMLLQDFMKMAKTFFDCDEVPQDHLDQVFRSEDIHIVVMKPKLTCL